jgi:hypothetical protein
MCIVSHSIGRDLSIHIYNSYRFYKHQLHTHFDLLLYYYKDSFKYCNCSRIGTQVILCAYQETQEAEKEPDRDQASGSDPNANRVQRQNHRLQGLDIKLVIQKELTITDMNPFQDRLSSPRGQNGV